MSGSQRENIIRLQNLYKTYSQLEFSNTIDRPIVVDGIQNRLLNASGTRAGWLRCFRRRRAKGAAWASARSLAVILTGAGGTHAYRVPKRHIGPFIILDGIHGGY
ncbi:hypothetical protein GGR57DRAFT_475638 [Xylariaceae sp. FL1272]|nr:hypothetical protein GGR57DRAFT_475638 [Xylariaceae sp. FL1272]